MKKYTSIILEAVKSLPVLNLLNPVMNFLNSGDVFKKPVSCIYLLFALSCAISPIYFLYVVIDSSFFEYAPAKDGFGFFLIFLVVILVGVFGLRYWLERSVNSYDTSGTDEEYVGTPVFTNFIQNIGEWTGSVFATAGAVIALIGHVLGGDVLFGFASAGESAVSAMITCIITGFTIILISRVFAELIRSLTSIASNTKK